MFLRYIYTVFSGILIALFIGVGINVFYIQPVEPQYPITLNDSGKETLTADQQKVQQKFEADQRVWNDKMKPYNRNVSIIALLFAVVLVATGLLLGERTRIIADGVTLGGVFTLIYSLGRGFASGNSKFSFLAVSVGLAMTILLGYVRFIRPKTAEV